MLRKNCTTADLLDKIIRSLIITAINWPPVEIPAEENESNKTHCLILPFGCYNIQVRKQLLKKRYPTLFSFFKTSGCFQANLHISFKDRIPLALRSNVVYKFTCDACNAFCIHIYYIGSTKRHLGAKAREHLN